jgi:hypothetical protein
MEQHLKTTYEKAVMKDLPDYKEVLWAMADHADLIRNTESIYSSYVQLFADANGNPQDSTSLDRSIVVSRLNTLKRSACGSILASARRGWYQFHENIMRGYVRLRAEEEGRELALDYAAASSSNVRPWRRGAKRGPIGTRPQDWTKLRGPG